jgi:hypothetical protein
LFLPDLSLEKCRRNDRLPRADSRRCGIVVLDVTVQDRGSVRVAGGAF